VESIRYTFPEHFSSAKVLEIGSWDVNGSIRQFFLECDYVGIDIAMGKGVDIVGQGENLDFPTASFDTVVSCECFEHNPYWLETFINMWRMLKPGGLCVVSCATLGRREHGTRRTTPGVSLTSEVQLSEYYRNITEGDFETRLDLKYLYDSHKFYWNVFSKDLYFVGIKRGGKELDTTELNEKLFSLGIRLSGVTTESGATFIQLLSRKLAWSAQKALIYALGRENYRNFEFLLSSVKRRLVTR
jgi:SAM-dependent methyltransferase